ARTPTQRLRHSGSSCSTMCSPQATPVPTKSRLCRWIRLRRYVVSSRKSRAVISFPVKNRLRSSASDPQVAVAHGVAIGCGAGLVWSSVTFLLRSRKDGVDAGASNPRRGGAGEPLMQLVERHEDG